MAAGFQFGEVAIDMGQMVHNYKRVVKWSGGYDYKREGVKGYVKH